MGYTDVTLWGMDLYIHSCTHMLARVRIHMKTRACMCAYTHMHAHAYMYTKKVLRVWVCVCVCGRGDADILKSTIWFPFDMFTAAVLTRHTHKS